MAKRIVAIGAGHGINTGGKRTPDDEREWSFSSKVVESAIKEFGKYDVKVIRLDDPTGKRDVPLKERTDKANAANADVYISCHHNAFEGVWGDHTGTNTFHYPGSSSGKKLAEAVHPGVLKAYGLRDRGIKSANFHVLRESRMPAILIEGGFMDSNIDIKKLRDDKVLKAAGKEVAAGVAKYLGLKKDDSSKSKKSSSKKKSVSDMAKEVIAGKHGSGHSKRRKSLGISSDEYKKVRAEVNKRVGGGSSKKASKPKPKRKANLSVDGKWGKDTTRDLQKALGTVVDGVISRQPRNSVTTEFYGGTISFGSGNGSPMVRALQRKVGSSVDGKLGPETVRRLQRHLGTVQDGKLSRPSLVVKELQKRLNAGTF